MAKRRCPFSDCKPQMKVHVTEKEVANGVLHNQLMRAVYDKTRNLLYQGAKGAVTLTPSAEFPSPMHHDSKLHLNDQCISTPQPFHLKQMTLDQHCQLQSSASSMVDQPSVNKPCSGCHVVGHQEMSLCAFCECAVCVSCTVTCNKCQEPFCSSCTFNMYDSGENHICRNCC